MTQLKAVMILILLFTMSFAKFQVTTLQPGSRANDSETEAFYEEAFNRSRYLTLNKSRSDGDDVHTALFSEDTLSLVLFEDLSVEVAKKSVKTTPDGGIFWKGDLVRGEDGYMILFYSNGILSGTLYSSDKVYNLNGLDQNTIRVVETDPTRIPAEKKECDNNHHSHGEECDHDKDPNSQPWTPPTLVGPVPPGPTVVDVMILYPSSVQSQMGGSSGMDAEVKKRVAEMNDVLSNSQINMIFNLVHHQVSSDIPDGCQKASQVLGSSEAKRLRDQYKADIVSFWSGSGGSAGNGFNLDGNGHPDNGYNTSKFSLVQTYYTFIHESGHNMGAKHDRAAYSSKPYKLELTPYYRYGKSFEDYRSVMSYDNCTGWGSCPRVPYYTNPDIMVKGAPFGVQGTSQSYDVNGPSNNSRRLNETARIVAAWRQGSTTVTTYTLGVSNGSGDGDYKSGVSVTITASSAPSGKEFSHWSGDTQYLADPNSATTTVTMPSKDINVTANYKDAIVEEFTLTVVSGSGDGSYPSGDKVTITADDSSNVGRAFSHWSGAKGYINDSTSNSATITMPSKDLRVTAQYEQPIVIDSSNLSINLIDWAGWEGVADSYGSEATVDTTGEKAAGSITTVPDNTDKNEYSWAKVSAYFDSTMDEVTLIKVTYSANKELRLVLEQDFLSENGASYGVALPATSDTTVYLPIELFTQNQWEGFPDSLKLPLEMSKVKSVSFEGSAKGSSSFEITELQFTNYEFDMVFLNTGIQKANALSLLGTTKDGLTLSVPQAGVYTVAINSLNGRQLFNKTVSLSEGATTIPASLSSGILLISIKGVGYQTVFKSIVR